MISVDTSVDYWVQAELGEIAEFVMGQAPKKSECNYQGAGTVFVKAGEFSAIRPVVKEWTTNPLKRANERDVLICVVGATAGKLNLGIDCAIGRSVAAIRPLGGVQNVFIYQYLRTQVTSLRKGSTGSAQGVISKTDLHEVTIPFPPLAEQKIIADKLDTLLAQVENTKARLERIPQILKRFRQSVLAAAVSGRLTEEWRGSSDLIGWEAGELGRFVEKPRYGSSAKSQKSGDIPVLRMGNLQDGKLDWADLVYTSDPEEIEKYRLEPGDVLFNRTNSPELVGKTSIFKGERDAIYAGYLIKIKCLPSLNAEFLNYQLNSPKAKDYCKAVKSDGVSQSNINAKKLAAYPLSCPPIEEQTEIVRRVDQLFAHADRIEQQVNNALARINNLAQSILAKAFRGELTEQWRKDNPELITGENSAEALLDRIKAERAAMKPAKKSRQKRTTA